MWRFRRVLVALVGLLTLALAAPWGAPRAVADDGDRLGCHTYCQTAGGYGAAGAGPKPPPAITLITNSVTAGADGYVPVTMRCNRAVQCLGWVGIVFENDGGGKSDLLVNAGSTRTIAIPLDAASIAYLRSHGPTQGYFSVDAAAQALNLGGDHHVNDSDGFASVSQVVLTVAPPG